MNRCLILLFYFFSISFQVSTQNMADYTAGWAGTLDDAILFSFKVELEIGKDHNAVLQIGHTHNFLTFPFHLTSDNNFSIQLEGGIKFKASLNKDKSAFTGFIQSGMLLYHIVLAKRSSDKYSGTWNILMVDKLESLDLYLSIENGAGTEYQAYPIFGDNRFTGTWCGNFQKNNDLISFSDYKTGLNFEGTLSPDSILLTIKIADKPITRVRFHRSQTAWKIGGFNLQTDQKTTVNKWLKLLEDSIHHNRFVNTHAVLVSKNGKTVYEKYFDGYNGSVPHDMRSASKSISSAVVGIAIDMGFIKDVKQKAWDYLPVSLLGSSDTLKARISLQNLLTMSSGLDAIDFGIDRNSAASEDNYQSSANWAQTVLSAPMLYEPGIHANYGSANPYLLGLVVDSAVKEPVEVFMDRTLFQPLNITNYIIQTDMEGRPYFGGGMYLTPADMLKFGQLYLNEGDWFKTRIISKEWVKQSFVNYLTLENTADKNGYGYLWWHHTYMVNGRKINSIEARGAGGQYIFVVPDLKAVAVITSGNYRNGKFQQPEKIFEKYLVPFLIN